MTIADQLKSIRSGLAAWARDLGGSVEIASDPVHLFAILALKPGAARACAIFKAENKRGEYEEAGFVDRHYLVVISRGRGFALQPGDSLTDTTAAGQALYDIIESARQAIRALSFDAETTEVTPNLLSIQPFAVETQQPVDAYQIEFTIGTQLPAVTQPS